MPALLALPAFWGTVSAGVAAGGVVYSARSQSGSTQRAGAIQERAARESEAFEREAETRRRQEYDQAQVRAKEQWDAEQAELVRQTAEEQRRYDVNYQEDQRRYGVSQQERQRAEAADLRAEADRRQLTQATLDERLRAEATEQRRFDADQVRRAPYRAAGNAAVAALTARSGQPAPTGPRQAPAYQGPAQAPLPQPARSSLGVASPVPVRTAPPPMLAQTAQTAPVADRMLTQGEVADLAPEKLEELLKYGFRLPPMGALVGPVVSRGY